MTLEYISICVICSLNHQKWDETCSKVNETKNVCLKCKNRDTKRLEKTIVISIEMFLKAISFWVNFFVLTTRKTLTPIYQTIQYIILKMK